MLIERPPPARLDPTVKALGFVTLLNDLSSEVAVRTLPLFLANVLGVKAGVIGFIEGLAESTATLLKVVSGVLADRVGKKKALALWGYGLSGFTKPLLFFAASWPLVLVVRVLDRIGKGIRTAPRDALIADVTAPEARGRAFGFNKAYGAFQGAASALVADLVPPELRGTAYGLFNGAIGVVAFPASLLAGLLWDWYGPPAPFLAGGLLALVAAVGVLTVIPQPRR